MINSNTSLPIIYNEHLSLSKYYLFIRRHINNLKKQCQNQRHVLDYKCLILHVKSGPLYVTQHL